MNRDTHYCKHCRSHFLVRVDEEENRDLLLVCPTTMCGWQHPRKFKDGKAVSCDINYDKAVKVHGRHN